MTDGCQAEDEQLDVDSLLAELQEHQQGVRSTRDERVSFHHPIICPFSHPSFSASHS